MDTLQKLSIIYQINAPERFFFFPMKKISPYIMTYIVRDEISFKQNNSDIETLWVEVNLPKTKPIKSVILYMMMNISWVILI